MFRSIIDAIEEGFVKQPVVLRGMTWSDPRGYDPVVAAAAAFARLAPNVSITWEKRSLQGFESTPVDALAASYDLMVIDHPHVGAVAGNGSLLAMETHADPTTLAELASETVGKSFASYFLAGKQWALPIDAATQVQAVRPDLGQVPLRRWSEVVDLARGGGVIWPLRPPHDLMSFFTLAANIGASCAVVPGPLLSRVAGLRVLEALQALADLVDPACYAMDPIAALNAMSEGGRFRLCPHSYLYAPYGGQGYRAHALAFHNIPALGESGPLGSALGGTGIAISARTKHPEICTRFALWLASSSVQRGLYAANNGQPGNGLAWADAAVNARVGNAYVQTRITHEAAWLRPRHAGYMGFQHQGSDILNDALRGRVPHAVALDALDTAFQESFAA